MNARRFLPVLTAAAMAITTALTVAVPSDASVAATQAGNCPVLSAHSTKPGTFTQGHHPLVLIPGWGGTSDSMWPVERGLKKLMADTFDFRYFDYRGNRSDWAARAPVASCLADYINAVSKASKGDGKVYVVAHSMGGLAIRFATDKNTVPNPVPASALGGVVTIDTPHLGSVFGNTWMATLVQWGNEQLGESLLPGHESDAARCLAIHGPGIDLPSGCSTPPYLPAGVPLAETAGTSIVRRTLFGVALYDIPLSSDGVVGVDSAHGYLTSGVKATKPPRAAVDLSTTSCTITSDQTMALLLAAVRGKSLPGAVMGAEVKALRLLWKDGAILDAINAGHLTPDIEVILGVALFFYPCGHNAMLRSTTTLADVKSALRSALAIAAPKPRVGVCGGVSDCHVVGHADLDGDGTTDDIAVVGHADQPEYDQWSSSNRPTLRVSTKAGIVTYPVPVDGWAYRPLYGGAASVDGKPGKEVIVGHTAGEHSRYYTMLTMRNGKLVTLPAPNTTIRAGDWGVDGSWRSNASYKCLGKGVVEAASAVARDPSPNSNSTSTIYDTRIQRYVWADGKWRIDGPEQKKPQAFPVGIEMPERFAGWQCAGFSRF